MTQEKIDAIVHESLELSLSMLTAKANADTAAEKIIIKATQEFLTGEDAEVRIGVYVHAATQLSHSMLKVAVTSSELTTSEILATLGGIVIPPTEF
jgi:hypothetical protein